MAQIIDIVNPLTGQPQPVIQSDYSAQQIDDAVGRVAATPGSGAITAADVNAIPSSQKGTAGGVATLGNNLQIPSSQIPALTADLTIYVDSASGNDSNPGTQQLPFATIQAAVDSLPKNLGKFTAVINIAAGNYPENVKISGFYNGEFSGALKIVGSSSKDQTRTVGSIFVANCATNVSVSGVCLNGNESGYAFHVVSASADLDNSIIDGSTSAAVNGAGSGIWGSANLRLFNCDITGLSANGISIGGPGILDVNSVTIQNCAVGISVGSSSAARQSIGILHNVTYQNCTSETQTYGGSQIFGG